MEEIAKKWMLEAKDDYLAETEDVEDCKQYLIEDCNDQAGTDLSLEDLERIANEIF